jgi:cysteine desulfuration protein SufE
MEFPRQLQEIIAFYERLSNDEKREALINEATLTGQYEPAVGEDFDLEDIRKDTECSDTVGIFVNLADDGEVTFKILLGGKVQTLTRAMAVILCRGLNGCSAGEIINLPESFVPRIVGSELHRLRSRTVYYVLRRLKKAVRALV